MEMSSHIKIHVMKNSLKKLAFEEYHCFLLVGKTMRLADLKEIFYFSIFSSE